MLSVLSKLEGLIKVSAYQYYKDEQQENDKRTSLFAFLRSTTKD